MLLSQTKIRLKLEIGALQSVILEVLTKKEVSLYALGRVIGISEETMQTDCRLLGGDSGGPLFNFDGEVIAIHSRISQEPDQNFHVPIECYLNNWEFYKNQKSSRLKDSLVKVFWESAVKQPLMDFE